MARAVPGSAGHRGRPLRRVSRASGTRPARAREAPARSPTPEARRAHATPGRARSRPPSSSHHRSPRSSRAEVVSQRTDRVALLDGVAAVPTRSSSSPSSLNRHVPPAGDPDVELEVGGVVARRRPAERLLEVEVPAAEAPVGGPRSARSRPHPPAGGASAPVATPAAFPSQGAAARRRSAGTRTVPARGGMSRAARACPPRRRPASAPRHAAEDLPMDDHLVASPGHAGDASGDTLRGVTRPETLSACRSHRGRRATRALGDRDALRRGRDARRAPAAAHRDPRGVRPRLRDPLRRRRLDGWDVRRARAHPRRRCPRPCRGSSGTPPALPRCTRASPAHAARSS